MLAFLEITVFESYARVHDRNFVQRTSSDGNVMFSLQYLSMGRGLTQKQNVNLRAPYGLGTVEAVRFLHPKALSGEQGKMYTMIDMMKGK